MNTLNARTYRAVAALTLLVAGAISPAFSAPGAHGPNGEHLDSNASPQSSGQESPSFEAKSELFELVGRLSGGELSLLIDRYDTNAPVLGATVEVETGSLKATAKHHADLGDYAIDDEAFLKALEAPGEHGLVITIVAGEDTDLLDGVLRVSTQEAPHGDHDHGHGPMSWTRWVLLALVLVGFALLARWWVTSRAEKKTNESKGEAA